MYVGRESGFRLVMKARLSKEIFGATVCMSISKIDGVSEQLCVPTIQCVNLDVKLGWMLIRIGAKQRPEQSKLESNGTGQKLEGSRDQRCGSRTQ